MAKTSTERSKQFRKKLKEDPDKYIYKSKDKERKKRTKQGKSSTKSKPSAEKLQGRKSLTGKE